MDVEEFNHIHRTEQAMITWQGDFIRERRDGDMQYALYHHPNFLIEVAYNLNTNQLIGFEAFEHHENLAEYLSDQDLHNLLNS